ncbi:unnamed protein product [Rotaria socialis]|uniref:Uncharacterized protein n=1 Tax=Rotaria socialis TaxID=392032 RepID=A0A817VSH7_9BILA|nr:unnamed protein product [Rotaria socialis]CAF3371010.1 unnamed protein product [Rotaria socialis]CAF3445595.1 unnamed protein product [Rotaria socialis]CAF3454986.1 unnamed protein product [Rotaria socialis]CAF3560132.1 unnamed protein product [Rotaria socialis]
MNAIHIIMATSNSANPHATPNARIESIARKRKISAVIFLIFGILLLVAGSLLATYEKQRFSVSFIVFGGIGIIFAFMYWISAEKILTALRKLNAQRIRQARFYAQNSGTISFANMNSGDFHRYSGSFHIGLPSYEQSVLHPRDIPPSYEEAINNKAANDTMNYSSHELSSMPIHSISLLVDQAEDTSANNVTTGTIPNQKRTSLNSPAQ